MSVKLMKIEILYIDGCPSYKKAEGMVKGVLEELGVQDIGIELIRVKSFHEAEANRFLGSPTIRVNGVDVDPDAERHSEYEMAPRTYKVKGNETDLPDIRMVRDSIKKAKAQDDEKASRSADGKGSTKYGAKPLPRPKKGMGRTFKGKKTK